VIVGSSEECFVRSCRAPEQSARLGGKQSQFDCANAPRIALSLIGRGIYLLLVQLVHILIDFSSFSFLSVLQHLPNAMHIPQCMLLPLPNESETSATAFLAFGLDSPGLSRNMKARKYYQPGNRYLGSRR
jgi:hypothetical protein